MFVQYNVQMNNFVVDQWKSIYRSAKSENTQNQLFHVQTGNEKNIYFDGVFYW
jgi:hypothetical protein